MAWLRSFVVWLTLAESIALAAKPGVPTAQTLRIARNGDTVLVPVDAGANRRFFVFDTGSNGTAVDASLRPLLGREMRRRVLFTPNGTLPATSFAPTPMSIVGRPVQGVHEVLCVDLEPMRADGEPIFGILGMDAISTMIVRIDFDSGELSILPSLPADAGEPLELVRDRGLPCVRVRVAGRRPVVFLIDTGAIEIASGDLESGLFHSLLEAGDLSIVGEAYATSIARTTRARLGRVAELRIGSHRHSGLIFHEGPRNVLSLGFLSRYAVVFDFPGMRMYLAPGKRFNDPDRHNLSGLHLLRNDGETTVESLDDQSAGQRAGLRAGDVLLSIDRTAVHSLPPIELRRMLATPSTRSLMIRRGETTMQCSIELREEQPCTEAAPRSRTSRRTFFQRLVPRRD